MHTAKCIKRLHGTEQQAVLISGMGGRQVIQVEHLDLEYCVVGTPAEVGHRHYGNNLTRDTKH